ncbi:MAG: PCRF domain-containing protein [Rhodocyclaceae bacterium]|nr:PCRF domain-containing protein [Rhodocyclaceae bacterium]
MKVLVEIRPGEGGEDARLLVTEHAKIYLRFAERTQMTAEVQEGGRGQL